MLRLKLRRKCHHMLPAGLQHMLPESMLPDQVLQIQVPSEIALPPEPLRPFQMLPDLLPDLLPAGLLKPTGLLRPERLLQRRGGLRHLRRSGYCSTRSRHAHAQ